MDGSGPLPSLTPKPISVGLDGMPENPGGRSAKSNADGRGSKKVGFNQSATVPAGNGGGDIFYGGEAGGNATMSRVLSLRSTKDVSSLYNFNPDDPNELLGSSMDLPAMRDMPEGLAQASPRARKARTVRALPPDSDRPAVVRLAISTSGA